MTEEKKDRRNDRNLAREEKIFYREKETPTWWLMVEWWGRTKSLGVVGGAADPFKPKEREDEAASECSPAEVRKSLSSWKTKWEILIYNTR